MEESKSRGRDNFAELKVDTKKYLDPSVDLWEEIRPARKHPARRSYHSASVWQNRMFIYGGQDLREGPQRGFWELHLSTSRWEEDKWEELSTEGLGPLCRHSAVVNGDNMYIFGGSDGITEYNTTLIYNFANQSWSRIIPENPRCPPPLDSHSAALYDDGTICYIIVFGGYVSGDRSNETYVLNLNKVKWRQIPLSSSAPEPRANHACAVHGDYFYIFGGSNEEGEKLNDLWKLNLKTDTWQQINAQGDIPSGRSGHSAVVFKEFLIIFGGMKDITRETNEMYSFNFERNLWACFQGEHQVKDPVTAEQLEEYKKSKASPTMPRIKNDCSSPTRSPVKRTTTTSSPHGDSSPSRRKTLYDGPATPISGRIRGNAPHARDGHSAVILGSIMMIFGGDRHQMPFNDVYAYTLVDNVIAAPVLNNLIN